MPLLGVGEADYQVFLGGVLAEQLFSISGFEIGEFKAGRDSRAHLGEAAAMIQEAALPGALRHHKLQALTFGYIRAQCNDIVRALGMELQHGYRVAQIEVEYLIALQSMQP